MVLNKYAAVRSKTAGFNFLNSDVIGNLPFAREYMEACNYCITCKSRLKLQVCESFLTIYMSLHIGRWAHFNVKLHF